MNYKKLLCVFVTLSALNLQAQVFDEEDLAPSQNVSIESIPQTSESDCQPVDYRPRFNLKMRNQKNIAWCFAHASSDNLQMTEKSSVQISAADVAISYSNTNISKILNFFQHRNDPEPTAPEFGIAKIAIRRLEKQGYCPEKIFPSQDWKRIDRNGETQFLEVDLAAREIFKLYDVIQDKISKGEKITGKDLPFYYQFNKVNNETFFKILSQSKKSEVLEKLRQTICDGQRLAFKSDLSPAMYFNKRKISRNMNTALNYGKNLSIDFSSPLLKNIDDDKLTIKLHTVAVMGRRYNKKSNQCEYLLKDSYGAQCSRYDSRIACEAGYVWLPENHLLKASSSIMVLK